MKNYAIFSYSKRLNICKCYRFLSFAKTMGKKIGKNISKNLRGKYSQKFLNHDKQSATDALKTISKKVFQKTAEATGDFIGKKIEDKIIKLQKNCNRIIKTQLKKNIIKNYLAKHIYLQKKNRKLLMI